MQTHSRSFLSGWVVGFEPTVFGSTIRRFNQLSHTHHIQFFCITMQERALKDSNL